MGRILSSGKVRRQIGKDNNRENNSIEGVLFVRRRVDILNNCSLKIQYNRNRYYDYYTGRWLTQDPLGITPNPRKPNVFDAVGQYKNGLSLYEYVNSNPAYQLDPLALSWCTLDFVHHYFGLGFIDGIWLWPGTSVDLATVGLLPTFKSAPSVVAAVSNFKSLVDQGVLLMKMLLGNCATNASFGGSSPTTTNVTWEPCLFAVGNSSFMRHCHCTLFPDPGDHCKWDHTCTLTFSINDEFADPLDMGIELPGGTTYPITASWSEIYP